MKSPSDLEFTAFVGLDWADKKHDICLQAAGCEATSHSFCKSVPGCDHSSFSAASNLFICCNQHNC
jgi:hypothetical protein